MNYPRLNLANFLIIIAKIGNNLCLAAVYFLLLNLGTSTSAQVIPDNTLPNNSLVNQNGNLIEILEGTTAGSNLFHSFEQFSLPTGNTAWFQNATAIDNIITRVTGGSLSSIDGLIRANGTANLFFLNPNGIIFGPNAQLDLGGSFLGTTADSLKFGDGSEFSAIDPQAPPILTVNITPGLQYGTGNGEIVVQGEGNLLAFNNPVDLIVDRSSRPRGLEVDTGKTLALVGNNVFVEGGNLTAEAGSIELGSVGDNSLVQLNSADSGWSFDYSGVNNFQDLNLSQASSLEVSGNRGGDVNLQGKQIIITDGSAILADTFGNSDGGKLQVNASELLVVAGTSENLPFISRLSTDVAPGATGNGGDIELNTGSLIVTDGAQILSSSYSGSNTGNIKVTAGDVELSSDSPIANSSGLFTLVFGSGNSEDIDITANNISILDGGQAAALTFGDGKGGNLNVNADSIEIIGASPAGIPSILATDTIGIGDGGNLQINSEYLLVAGGGKVQSSVFSSGNGGDLEVNATEVELIGGAPEIGASGLFANLEPGAIGSGGQLSIDTQFLLITDGAQASITNFGSSNTGILDVKAENIELVGTSPGGFSSGLFSNVELEATGNGGHINVETQNLQIADGAQIGATNFGLGTGGSVRVKASEIEVRSGSPNAPSGLFTTVAPAAEGNGGSLVIETENLKVIDGGQIAVSTAGLGNGGELEIIADTIELIGGSEFGASGIFGNAIIDTGNGGNLIIDTDSLTILDGATISVSNFSSRNIDLPPGEGKAGSIAINANRVKLDTLSADTPSSITASTHNSGGGNIDLNIAGDISIANNSEIDADTKGDRNGGNINITANNLNLNSQGRVSVNSTGLGQAGNIEIEVNNLEANQGKIAAASDNSGGGDIKLVTDFIFLARSELSTSVDNGNGGGGNLEVDSNYIIARDNSNIIAQAFQGNGGNIKIGTQVILLTPDSLIDASSERGVDGAVDISSTDTDEQIGIVQLPENITDPTALIAAVCPKDKVNALATTGKGGLAENPSQNLRGESVWEDLRNFVTLPNVSQKIIEATAWNINRQGNVELVSHIPQQQQSDYWTLFNQCRQK